MMSSSTLTGGLTFQETPHYDCYMGTAAELVAAGIVDADQFPGLPGNGKTMCTYRDGVRIRKGDPTSNRKQGYRRIVRLRKELFEVSCGVAAEVSAARMNKLRQEWQRERLAVRAWPFPCSNPPGVRA